jgi:cell division transport system permease protein
MPGVADAEYVSRDQALEEFQQQSGLGEARSSAGKPAARRGAGDTEEVDKPTRKHCDKAFRSAEGTAGATVWSGSSVWQPFSSWVTVLSSVTVLLVSALLLVIGNTIRLHIENRRTEIEVIKLVGGTDSYVRRPFLYMGALYGFGAGILAWGRIGVWP